MLSSISRVRVDVRREMRRGVVRYRRVGKALVQIRTRSRRRPVPRGGCGEEGRRRGRCRSPQRGARHRVMGLHEVAQLGGVVVVVMVVVVVGGHEQVLLVLVGSRCGGWRGVQGGRGLHRLGQAGKVELVSVALAVDLRQRSINQTINQ